MRAALLPAGADPFLVAYWLNHYERVWSSEVDELRVQVSGLMERNDGTREYLEALPKPANVVMTFSGARVDHGQVIARLLSETSADHVMLCEDDAFVRRPGVVAEAFRRVESGETDIVASPRATATPNVLYAASRAFGWQVSPSGEAGPFMWPCFLFTRRSALESVETGFSVHHWLPGDSIKGTGQIAIEEGDADTFAAASMDLMEKGYRVHWTSQYRSDEMEMGSWHDAPWFHVGSLSASTEYLLNKRLPIDRPEWIADVRTSSDWVKRVSWFRRLLDCSDGGLPEVHAQYRAELEAMVRDASISEESINRWTRLFDPFVTWPERAEVPV